jgi:acyl-coenzyme A synthetase/AMP-(fatty) acid ligase
LSTFYDLIFNEQTDWRKELLITNVNRYSLHDIHSKVEEFISILQSEGELKGKKVATLAPSLTEYISILIAVNKLGGTFIPLSPKFRTDDLTKVLDLTKPNLVFTSEEYQGTPFKQIIENWAIENINKTTLFTTVDGEYEKSLIKGNEDRIDVEDIDIIACTSGSTGAPKGLKLKIDSMAQWSKEAVRSSLQLHSSDRIFLTIPTTAPYGITWLLTGFQNGISMVVPENFDMPIVMKLLTTYPCNKISSSPSIFKGIYLFAKSINPEILSRIEICSLAGEPVKNDFISLISDLKKCQFNSCYGLSEQGILMYNHDIRSEVAEWSVCNDIEYKVVNVSADGNGELAFKTPYGFSGYYRNEQLTREVLTSDGWFYTGDLVRVNEHHKIEIVGRKKEMIKKGGVQVIPGEIEQILNQYPLVTQSAVVGIPHSVYGEEIFAFVVAAVNLNVEELFVFVRERIAGFKVPGKIKVIKEMPVIQGKLDKVTLKKIANEYSLGVKK